MTYNDIIGSMILCVDEKVLKKRFDSSKFKVPGWSDLVQEIYEASRNAILSGHHGVDLGFPLDLNAFPGRV